VEQIIIVHWDKSIGPQPIIQYPPQENLPSNDLYLKIWALHELDKQNSMIEYIPEEGGDQYFSILQTFQKDMYFIILVYQENMKFENIINKYPDILAIISKNLIDLIYTDKFPRAISEAFNTIKNLHVMDEEDILINFFFDRIKFTILRILRRGVISKIKLIEVLRSKYGFSTSNIDLILIAFIRENLILIENAPGVEECYFLINDISYMRIPPEKLPKNLNKLKEDANTLKKYKSALLNVYLNQDYDFLIENKKVMKFLVDKEVFELIKTLRNNVISVKRSLNILNNRIDLFNELIEKNYIFEIKGFVFLLTDVRFIKFPPVFLFKKLITRYRKNKISFDEFLMHTNMLSNKIKIQPDNQFEII